MQRATTILALCIGFCSLLTAPGLAAVTVSKCDITMADLAGAPWVNVPEADLVTWTQTNAIRKFPVPAAAGWTNPTLVYDNWAVLGGTSGFSTALSDAGLHWVAEPFLSSTALTINGANYLAENPSITDLVVDNSHNQYFTNTEDSPGDTGADPRFPYRIPRPGGDCTHDFSEFEFELSGDVGKFGLFLPAHSNYPYERSGADNFLTQTQAEILVYVQLVGQDPGTVTSVPIRFDDLVGGYYCPFLTVDGGGQAIEKVWIIHDGFVQSDPAFGLMDVYTEPVPEPATLALPASGGMALAGAARRRAS